LGVGQIAGLVLMPGRVEDHREPAGADLDHAGPGRWGSGLAAGESLDSLTMAGK
jgi:hypothetical protein